MELATTRKTVFLLKASKEDDLYQKELESAGFQVHFVPVLSFTFCNEQLLLQKLEDHQRYSGVIITSPRTVQAIQQVVKERLAVLESWKSKEWFSIGHETFDAIERNFQIPNIYGHQTNCAQELSSVIEEKHVPTDKPLLFLCSNRRRDLLPNKLRSFNIPFEELTVYSTTTDLSVDSFKSLPDWIAFFSPSGVDAFKEQLGKWKDSQWEREGVKVAAIGSTTALALESFVGLFPPTAREPTPKGLCEVLRETQ